MRALVEGMQVHPERMLENLDASYGLVFSQPVLLALVEAGRSRDDAYRMVQRNAMKTWEERRPFLDVLREDPEVTAALDAADARCLLRPQARGRQHRPHLRRPRRRSVTVTIDLPHLYSGKVRDLYDAGDDRILLVASDRVSVFDVVLPDPIPDKGRVLTAISSFWFDLTADLLPNHVLSVDPADFPAGARPDADGRAMLVRRTEPVPMECIARGLPLRRRVEGVPRAGHGAGPSDAGRACRRPRPLPEPLFTPTTKADEGHDLPMTDDEAVALVGADAFGRLRDAALAIYARGAEHAGGPRDHPRRHEVRVRDHARRRAAAHRRGADARLVAVLAGRRVRPRRLAAELRQAVRARPLPRHRLGPDAARAAGAGRGRRGHAGALRRGVRADHRPRVRGLVRPGPDGGDG